MTETQRNALAVLAEVWALSPDVRLGQLLAHLEVLGDAHIGKGLGEIEDDELVALLYRHRAELEARTAAATLAPLARQLGFGSGTGESVTYTPAEVNVLRKIRNDEPLSSRDVGEAFNVASGTIARNARQHGIGVRVGRVHTFDRDDLIELAKVVNRAGPGNPNWRTKAGAVVTDADCLAAYREHGTYMAAGQALGLSYVNVRKRAMRAMAAESAEVGDDVPRAPGTEVSLSGSPTEATSR